MCEVRRRNPTIEYLRQALRADRQIDALLERAEMYRNRSMQATSRATATRTSGTGSRSRVEDCVMEMLELEDAMKAEISELAAKVAEIERVIDQVRDDRYRDLLRWRYLNGWTWERIAEGLDLKDVRWVYEMHGRALKEIEKILRVH